MRPPVRLQKPADVAPADVILRWNGFLQADRCRLKRSEGHTRQQLISDPVMPADAWFGVGLSQNTVASKGVSLPDSAALTAEMRSCMKRRLEPGTLRPSSFAVYDAQD